jgi:hypothetical protein
MDVFGVLRNFSDQTGDFSKGTIDLKNLCVLGAVAVQTKR